MEGIRDAINEILKQCNSIDEMDKAGAQVVSVLDRCAKAGSSKYDTCLSVLNWYVGYVGEKK